MKKPKLTSDKIISEFVLDAKHIKKCEIFTVKQLKQKVQDKFNEFIRLRDSEFNRFTCISCGKVKDVYRTLDAGHYYKVSIDPVLRYDERNVNGQCRFPCNGRLGGNEANYIIGLENKIGSEACEELKQAKLYYKQNTKSWQREELIILFFYYSGKVKELKNCD